MRAIRNARRSRAWKRLVCNASPLAAVLDDLEHAFTCKNCRNVVSTAFLRSAVRNRNHCPYCLWSRHLDLIKAGDRLSACKGMMRPIGLTIKATWKKYNPHAGELMLVHECEACGRVSINRIAADDDSEAILRAFQDSLSMDEKTITSLEAEGVRLLRTAQKDLLLDQLFGCEQNSAERSLNGVLIRIPDQVFLTRPDESISGKALFSGS